MRRYIGHGRRAIEEHELRELLLGAPPRSRVLWLLAADCGLRRAEARGLEEEDVHGGRLRVRSGKGDVSRWTVATGRVLAELESSGFLRRRRPGYCTVGAWFRRDRCRAGLPSDLSMHSLRHRFATRLLRSGVSLVDIQMLMGHRDLATTAVYLHADPRRFDTARRAMESDGFPQPLLFPDSSVMEGR